MIGVNLLYGCYHYYDNPEKLLLSLLDDLSKDRIEIDMIRFEGPDFKEVDNRLMSLYLVKHGYTQAAVFGPDGSITQQSDLIFLGGGLENKDSRNSTAIFAEASKDISDKLQVIGAARYEKLTSDSTFDPKVSMRYQMNDNLVLRGSYSTSFREASLAQLTSFQPLGSQGYQPKSFQGL